MYCPAQMKDSQRGKFYEWYSKNKNGVFDYQKELQKYTESDVGKLRIIELCNFFKKFFT